MNLHYMIYVSIVLMVPASFFFIYYFRKRNRKPNQTARFENILSSRTQHETEDGTILNVIEARNFSKEQTPNTIVNEEFDEASIYESNN